MLSQRMLAISLDLMENYHEVKRKNIQYIEPMVQMDMPKLDICF